MNYVNPIFKEFLEKLNALCDEYKVIMSGYDDTIIAFKDRSAISFSITEDGVRIE